MSDNFLGIGTFFMVGLPGPDLDNSTLALIREYRIHNFILFTRNVSSREQLGSLCRDLRAACAKQGLDSPLIAIDQEGGSVTRLLPPFTQFPDAREMAESENPEGELSRYAAVCARELIGVGINMNLAPVLDVCPADEDLFMERRSLGGDPDRVAYLGALIIGEMQGLGLAACAKHFPGLGAAVIDPHKDLPVVARPLAELLRQDLQPFRAAVRAEVAAIMTSHTIYEALDSETATLSERILSGLLRRDLEYGGLIITDDLEMGAIESRGSIEQAALKAFAAGADLLLICHDHDKVIRAVQTVGEAVREGRIPQERLRSCRARLHAVSQRFSIPLLGLFRKSHEMAKQKI